MNHCIRIRCAPPNAPQEVLDEFDQLRNDRLEVLPEQATGLAPVDVAEGEDDPSPEHWYALYRFHEDEDVAELAEEIENIPIPGSRWVTIDVHACDHDENSPSGCSNWARVRDKGDVPDAFVETTATAASQSVPDSEPNRTWREQLTDYFNG